MKACKAVIAFGVFGALLSWVSPSAYALEISPLVGVSSSGFSASPDLSGSSSSLGFHLGGTVEWDLAPFLTSEVGALFFTQPYQVSSRTDYFASGFRLPAIVRFNPIPYFSAGIGGYLAIHTLASVSGSPSAAVGGGSQALDYGLLAAIGGRYPVGPFSRLRLDVLYFFGLPNLSGGTTTLNTRTLSVLGGVTFDLQ